MSVDVSEVPSVSVVRVKRFKKVKGAPVLGMLDPEDKALLSSETSATHYQLPWRHMPEAFNLQ